MRETALNLFDASIQNIIQYTANGILALLPQAAAKGTIPEQLIQLCRFVKGPDYESLGYREVGGGRVLPSAPASKLLKYIPFHERSFIVYVADVVVALALQAKLVVEQDGAFQPPFQTAIAFLDVVGTVCDTHRCHNQEMVKAIDKIVSLGLGLVSNRIMNHNHHHNYNYNL